MVVQAKRKRTVNTNRKPGASGVVDDIEFSPVFGLAFQVGNGGRIIMREH
jgi:hypothetical protein